MWEDVGVLWRSLSVHVFRRAFIAGPRQSVDRLSNVIIPCLSYFSLHLTLLIYILLAFLFPSFRASFLSCLKKDLKNSL